MQEPNNKFQKEKECNKRVLIEFTKLLNITPAQLIEENKNQIICEMRHLYCKLRCDIHKVSFATTGIEINRHCSTVGKGVRRINNLLSFEDERVVAIWNLVKDIPKENCENFHKVEAIIYPWYASVSFLPMQLKTKSF